MTSWLPTAVGLIAGCLSAYAYVPQVLKLWREDDAEAVSKRMFVVRGCGLTLWMVYGFVLGSIPVLIFSVVNFLLSLSILVLKIRHERLGRTGAGDLALQAGRLALAKVADSNSP